MESKFKTEVVEERALQIVCEPENPASEKESSALDGSLGFQPASSSSSSSSSPSSCAAVPSNATAAAEPMSMPVVAPSTESVVVASSMAASNSTVAAATSSNPLSYNIGPSLSFAPVRGDSRAKQLFNAVYFGATGVAIAATINYLHLHLFWPIVSFLVLAGLMALRFTINNRAHPKDFEVNFSTASRRFIRAAALLLPIPFLVLAMARIPANWEYDEGMKLYDSANYAAAVPHFETALRFNGQYSEAQEMLTYSYFFSDDFQKALASANVALLAYPDNSSLLAEKAYVLNLNEKYQEAIPLAQKAAQLDPTNGQAFSCLAESNYRLGHFLPALEAANMHVKLHYDEAEAFRSRQSILSSLGRDGEAALDGAAAAKLESDQAANDTTSTSTDNSGTTNDTN